MLPPIAALPIQQQIGHRGPQDPGVSPIAGQELLSFGLGKLSPTQLSSLPSSTDNDTSPISRSRRQIKPRVANTARRRVSFPPKQPIAGKQVRDDEASPKKLVKKCLLGKTAKSERLLAAIPESRPLTRDEILLLLARDSPSLTSNHLDPFSVLPEPLNLTQKELLYFYLEPYWSTAQPFAPTLRPNPRITSLQQAVNCPVMLHVVLGRAAFHLVSLHSEISPAEKKRLEVAALNQRVEAVATLKKRLAHLNRSIADNDDILTSTMCMATFEYRYGSSNSASVHFAACRSLFRATGGLSKIQDKVMERQALWFECAYAKAEMSFVFDPSDANVRVAQLAKCFHRIAAVWRKDSASSPSTTPKQPFIYLDPQTPLFRLLSKDLDGTDGTFLYKDYSEISAQLTCLMMYVQIILETTSNAAILQAYNDRLGQLLVEQQLNDSVAVVNLMWLMLTDIGIPEVDSVKRRWHVAGLMNAVKYLNLRWQMRMKAWLLAFIRGDAFEEEFKFDLFAFSYDAGVGI